MSIIVGPPILTAGQFVIHKDFCLLLLDVCLMCQQCLIFFSSLVGRVVWDPKRLLPVLARGVPMSARVWQHLLLLAAQWHREWGQHARVWESERHQQTEKRGHWRAAESCGASFIYRDARLAACVARTQFCFLFKVVIVENPLWGNESFLVLRTVKLSHEVNQSF